MAIQSDQFVNDPLKAGGNKYQQPMTEWLVLDGILSQKMTSGMHSVTHYRKNNGDIPDFQVSFRSEYGHLKYTLNCPLCREEIISLCGMYPESITCPYCKTQFKFRKL